MQVVKIVVTGAYSAGKSNFIRTISEIETVDTDYAVTLAEEREQKTETTVALDFGTIAIDGEVVLYLFGTPGQERFDFMWEHLTVDCLGYVVLVDSTRPEYFPDVQRLIARFAALTSAPFVVAANKQDDPGSLPPGYIRQLLALPERVAVVPCVGTDKESVKGVLLTLLDEIVASLPEDEPAGIEAMA